jgi:hypothetical protein
MGSLHVQTYDEVVQDQLRCDDIDLINERNSDQLLRMHGSTRCSTAIISSSCVANSSKWMT